MSKVDYSIVGERFGRLTVLELDHVSGHGNSYWRCRCDCGTIKTIARFHLMNGHATSCGCYKKERATIHGQYYSPVYNNWNSMKERCTDPKHAEYDRYGGRGIGICDEWLDVRNFNSWATENGYAPGLTLDRIDGDQGYSPENCRWVDWYVQQNNRSNNRHVTYNGVTHTVAEWARILDVKYATLLQRINKGNMRDFERYLEEL